MYRKIKYINLTEKQIEQLKEWKKIPAISRQYRCPFEYSASGGKLCAKAFSDRCHAKPKDSPKSLYFEPINLKIRCRTSPCPCGEYTYDYVMRQVRRAIKYGRI